MKQKKKLGRKVISYLLALVMVFSTMTGIVPGMSLTAYAESYNGTTYLSGNYNLRNIRGGISVGAVYSQNCKFTKPNVKGFTLYDVDGTTVLKNYAGDSGLETNISMGCDIVILSSASSNGTFTTAKKCYICSFTSAPTAKENLTYDGTEQDLINAGGSVTGGTMYYQLGESSSSAPTGEWTTTVPKGTVAGTYYVWYKVTATEDNYADYPPTCVTVTIAHTHSFTYSASGATITATCTEGCPGSYDTTPATLTIAAEGGTYDGTTAYSATVTNNISDVTGDTVGEVAYYKVDTEGATTGGTAQTGAPTDAGYYYASVTLTSGSNTYTAFKAFTVAKADPTAPIGLTATYGQRLADVNLPKGWSWANSTQSVGSVGSNTFKANFAGSDNYNAASNVDVTVTVSKAANPATITNTASVTKGGNTIDLASNVTKNGATGDVTYAISGEANGCSLNGSVLTSGDNTGSVTVNVTIAADDNYNALAATPITVTINDKQAQTITASDVTATYGDTDKKVTATVTDPATGGGTISYAVKNDDEDYIDVNASTGALTIKKAGTATVIVTAAETSTYKQATREVTVTISKANAVVATVTANNRTYDGTEKPLVTVTGEPTGGTMYYALGENATSAPTTGYTTSIPAKTNVGTYYVWYKVNGDENHNDVDPACVEAKINPVDKTALDSAISAAETYYNQIKDNADYADIASALNTAITNATAVKNNANVTSGAVATAVTAINTAKTTAEAGVKDVDDTKAANAVITAINDLPEADEVTAENEKAIIEARKAYDALTTDQKKKVSADILNKLTATETALNTVNTSAAKDVTDAITDLPAAADVKDSDEAAIKAARAAYDKLTDTQKGLVSYDTLKKLTDAEKALDTVNTNAAKEVSDAIAKLPASDKVAATDKEAIEAARKAYDALTADQKKKVSDDTLKKLTDAETALDTLNKNSAKAVTDAIGKLPASDKVATTDKDAIEAAKKAYDALTPDQKKLVDDATLKKLTDVETALKAAQKKEADDTSAADKVVSTITALPVASKVTTTDKAAIEAARKAYDALTADQKKKVSADTLKKLTDAETALTAAEKKAAEDKAAAEKKAAEEKAARELAAAKQEAQAAMNEQVTVTQKGNKLTVKWKKSSAADGYYVYAQYCGKKITKPAKTIAKNTTTKTTITKINGKKINQKRQFRVYVVPYKIIDGKKVALGKSIGAHLVGAKSTKYSNVKKLTLTKSKYTVKVGKTAKIKAKVTLVNKNKKHIPKSHGAKFRYKSSDTSIATVDKNGKIKGIKKGTCTIYVYSINGLMKKAKVTIK